MKETARVSVMCHKPMQGVSFARKTGAPLLWYLRRFRAYLKFCRWMLRRPKWFSISVVYSFFDKYEEVTFWLQYT